MNIEQLSLHANSVRESIIKMLYSAGSGHSAGPLGMADIFVALYFKLLTIDPSQPKWSERDRVILSNGHICPVWYATLAERGYFDKKELVNLRKLGSFLQGHPHRDLKYGIENSSGPLGQGFSQAVGVALAGKMNNKDYFTYCLSSDGEHDEGQTWEAIMLSAKEKLSKLITIVDRNYIQIDGYTENVMPLDDMAEKYRAFNWHVQEIDGNNFSEIIEAVENAKAVFDRPSCIIARTIPGKGISFMENDFNWHGKTPNKDEEIKAINDLRTLNNRIKSEHQ
ncbi:MAG: Transketolase domain protein [Berkelbacteria bacterium GW2011_GWA2_35_9]|uniref:Transketolase domain protein n=1 Tax=Berkelbacteria bacterium GW2011_GWA2_35_9 TaxID=1618333 RepID=A0A0G0FNI1_9BACT|nr:MAG: Transketolase domain protein [Berkelbacteria bacterium GW2011_GWA2_35_9]